MKSFVCLFVLLAAFSGLSSAVMDIVYLNETADGEGAVCLDGSSGAYYFKAGVEENRSKWVIHLCGGGMCMNDTECYQRSQTFVGSINFWPPLMAWGGPIDEDPVYNPDFYSWTHVFFPYCDGASFSGDREDPVEIMNTSIYYRGHRILVAGFKDLLKTKGLDQATDVFLVGDSAGAMATYFHVDEIKSMLPDTIKYKAAPFSGVFLDRPNVEGVSFWKETLEYLYGMQNSSGNQKCFDANPDDKYKCFDVPYLLDFIETPLFVLNSAYDRVAVQCIIMGEPLITTANGCGNCSAVPGWKECADDVNNCTVEQWDKIEEYAVDFRNRIENSPKLAQDGNGLFEYSCVVHDVEPSYGWDHFVVQDTLLRDAVRDWWLSDNEPSANHFYKDCANTGGEMCNPTCQAPSSSSSEVPSSSTAPAGSSSEIPSSSAVPSSVMSSSEVPSSSAVPSSAASSSVNPPAASSSSVVPPAASSSSVNPPVASSSVTPGPTPSSTPAPASSTSSFKPLSDSSGRGEGTSAGVIAAIVIISVLLFVVVVVVIALIVMWHFRVGMFKPAASSYSDVTDPLIG